VLSVRPAAGVRGGGRLPAGGAARCEELRTVPDRRADRQHLHRLAHLHRGARREGGRCARRGRPAPAPPRAVRPPTQAPDPAARARARRSWRPSRPCATGWTPAWCSRRCPRSCAPPAPAPRGARACSAAACMRWGLSAAGRSRAAAAARRRLNKLGTFNLAQLGQSKSPFAEFMRAQRKSNENFEESLLKLVRTLPAVLKYLPSEKAQVPGLPALAGLGSGPAPRGLWQPARPAARPPGLACRMHRRPRRGARARALPQAAVRARRTRAHSCRACSTGSAATRPTWRACC